MPVEDFSPARDAAGIRKRRGPLLLGATTAVSTAIAACMVLLALQRGDAQPTKYMNAAAWKVFLSGGGGGGSGGQGGPNWFSRWNTMIQPRIDQLAAIVEAEEEEEGGGGNGPFRVTMVGDSTMMMQHGVVCAFLGERQGRRFDPKEHQTDCCVDTLPRVVAAPNATRGGAEGNPNNHNSTEDGGRPYLTLDGEAAAASAGGGRGLCFRHAFERFAEPPGEELLGSPNAVYFGNGLHFLHMCRPGHGLEPQRVQGWLNYERDLEDAVTMYRAGRSDNFRLIFMTSHVIQESKYEGEFQEVVEGYHNDDPTFTAQCERQVKTAAGGSTGVDGYGPAEYCRMALMDRLGSEVLNRRSRPVMASLGVPLVEGDLIVKDQAWATQKQDGRHYHMLVPVEIWELLGVLVSPYARTEAGL